MPALRVTLHTDGGSDAALLPILVWAIRQHDSKCQVQPVWADLRRVPRPPRTLSERFKLANDLYPCDLLFVHRDAENQDKQLRYQEIQDAITQSGIAIPHVCVVPVRMQEAWLLFDENAIREAAGNPNGSMPLELPPIKTLEQIPDPKDMLFALIRQASGLSARRRQRLPVTSHAYRISSIIEDFAPLRNLSAFLALEADIDNFLSNFTHNK